MPRTRPPLRLRRGTDAAITAAFAASPGDFEVGEPIYATDTGRLLVRNAGGVLAQIGGSSVPSGDGEYGTFDAPAGGTSDYGAFQ